MTSFTFPRKFSLFVALSLADLALTWFLLEGQRGGAYEWNPIASWWLARFGWTGLAGFKLSLVLLVVALTLAVSRHRPRAADRLLGFGCAALLAVLLYSVLLVPGVYAETDYAERVEVQERLLERQLDRANSYTNLVYDLGNDLVVRRRSLGEAVEILSSAEKAHDPEWLRMMALRYPNLTQRELVGARLIEEAALSAAGGTYGSAQVYRELNEQFRSYFGRPAPRPTIKLDEELQDPR